MPTASTDEMLFERRGALGIATLNRPGALNAATLGMYRAFDAKLDEWERDGGVRALVVRGAGDRAFCAGGDVRAVYSKPHEALDFFREEYRFILRLNRFPKPVVALADGLTLGGGMGISVNSSHCVATERSSFAMPEIFIGFAPDVGATSYLRRAPGSVGVFLALTATRVGPGDAVRFGFARCVVPSAKLGQLVDAIDRDGADAALRAHHTDPGATPLWDARADIDRVFSRGSVAEIRAALERESAPWAVEAKAAMDRAAPTSLEVIFRQMHERVDLEGALRLEFRIVQHMLQIGDFREGVRAVLVDKDKKPQWKPLVAPGKFFEAAGTEPL